MCAVEKYGMFPFCPCSLAPCADSVGLPQVSEGETQD